MSSAKDDIFISIDDANDWATLNADTMYVGSIQPNENSLFLSMNESVVTRVNDGRVRSFILGRLKHNFLLYYKSVTGAYGYIDVPSEVIDITVIKNDTYDAAAFFKHADIVTEKYVYKYVASKPENNLNVIYNGLSVSGFVDDFYKVMYVEPEHPWKAQKMRKRIYRMLFFIYLELYKYDKLHLLRKLIEFFDVSVPDKLTIFNSLKTDLEHTCTLEIIEKHYAKYFENPNPDVGSPEYNELVNVYIEVLNSLIPTSGLGRMTTDVFAPKEGFINITHLGGNRFKKINKY